MTFDGIVPDLLIVPTLIFERVEGESPGKASLGIVSGESLAHGPHAVQAVPGALIAGHQFDVARDFPRGRSDHDAEGHESIAEE